MRQMRNYYTNPKHELVKGIFWVNSLYENHHLSCMMIVIIDMNVMIDCHYHYDGEDEDNDDDTQVDDTHDEHNHDHNRDNYTGRVHSY